MPLHKSDEQELKVVWQYQIDQLSKELQDLTYHLGNLKHRAEKKTVKSVLGETSALRKKYERLGKDLEKKWTKSIPRILGVYPSADSYSFALQSMMNHTLSTADELKKIEAQLADVLKSAT